MRARDVMVSPVITVRPSCSIREAAKTLVDRGISALPVVEQGELVGIISEGDFLHRSEAGTERRASWWLRLLTSDDVLAAEYTKAHARTVADVMTRSVITATADTPLSEIAMLLEKNSIKRVPILENGQLVGIVSRANIVQAVASARKALETPLSDSKIRDEVLLRLQAQPWIHTGLINATVSNGVVDLWGLIYSDQEKTGIRVAAENTPGVRAVNDHLKVRTFSPEM